MKVFADYHHGDLYWSLHALFENRLGWELYRPIGREWFARGLWKIAEPYGNAPDTIAQYLEIKPGEFDGLSNLNGGARQKADGTYRVFDPTHDYWHKAITYDGFMSTDFDLVLSTVEAHDGPYLEMAHEKGAAMAVQMGNVGQRTLRTNVLHSCRYTPLPNQHAVAYHQEVDRNLLRYVQPMQFSPKCIYSMVNCLPHREVFEAYAKALPEVLFRAYGSACPDGFLLGCAAIAAKIRAANMGWHMKPLGGLGHTAMAWAASGRPIITDMRELAEAGDDAQRLFVNGETCVDVGGLQAYDGARIVAKALEPEINLRMCEATVRRFDEVIRYDEEERAIRKWLEGVL